MSKIIGHLDKVTKNVVAGWALSINDPVPIMVYLTIDNQTIASKIAKIYRPDLLSKRMHSTGNCGFFFDLKNYQNIDKIGTVRLFAGKEKKELSNSPWIYNCDENLQLNKLVKQKEKIFFMHIGKTAGTSINHFIESHFPPNKVQTHLESFQGLHSIPIDKKFDFISGHLRIKEFIKSARLENHLKITLLREPIAHLISHISWVKRLSEDENRHVFLRCHKDIQTLSLKLQKIDLSNHKKLSEFIANFDHTEAVLFDNCQTRYFLSNPKIQKVTEKNAQEAINAFSYFDIVGINEEYNKFIQLICDTMNWKCPPTNNRLNVQTNKYGMDINNPKVREILIKAVSVDQIVYEEAKNTFYSQWHLNKLKSKDNKQNKFANILNILSRLRII